MGICPQKLFKANSRIAWDNLEKTKICHQDVPKNVIQAYIN